MFYPLCLRNTEIFSIFGKLLLGNPHIFDFSSENKKTFFYNTENFDSFQNTIFGELKENGKSWGIWKYLEERSGILRHYPQIIREGRIYHVGIDVVVPAGSNLFSPLDATVFCTGKEQELGSYGGFVILEHHCNDTKFYTFWGHLDSAFLPAKGFVLSAGHNFARLGDYSDSGGWFTHLHLQVLTPLAIDRGLMQRGYVSASDIPEIDNFFPSPYPLFKW